MLGLPVGGPYYASTFGTGAITGARAGAKAGGAGAGACIDIFCRGYGFYFGLT